MSEKELKERNEWLSKEHKRMHHTIDELNQTIEVLQTNMETMLKTLRFCAVEGVGTAYQQREARCILLDVNEGRYLSALKNIKRAAVKKELTDAYEYMQTSQTVVEHRLNRFFNLIDKYSTYQEGSFTRNPFSEVNTFKKQ